MIDHETHIHKQHLQVVKQDARMWQLAQEASGEQKTARSSDIARIISLVRRSALWIIHNLLP